MIHQECVRGGHDPSSAYQSTPARAAARARGCGLMAKTNATCRACRFFLSEGGFSLAAIGSCCRRAPTAIAPSAEVLDYDQLWPNVRGGYWCGEFELADDREVAD